MAAQTDGMKFSSLTKIPRTMLLIVVIDWAMWFVALPIALGLRFGETGWFEVAGFGLLLVPIGVMVIFLRRLLMYFVVMFYWYIVGLACLIGILVCTLVITAVLFMHSTLPFSFHPEQALALVPSSSVQPLGVILLILALTAVFALGRLMGKRASAPKFPQVPTTNPPAPISPVANAHAQIQQQLLQRQQRLNKP